MSGHNNPHGHLGQPNASWNPMQVPFVARQPQLAHMSSERPISHSPLTWHTPTPQEALFAYISNHKNTNTDLNPLLPTFSRTQNTSPFGTVDLSLTHSVKTASPKPLGTSPSRMADQAPLQLSPAVVNNQPPLAISPQLSVIQSTASIAKEQSNCTSSPTPQGIFVKDARQINNDIMKFAREIQPTQNTDPAAEAAAAKSGVLYSSIKNLPASGSPKRNSPLRPSTLPNQSPIPSHTPPVCVPFQPSAPANQQNLPDNSNSELPTISNDSNSNFSNDAGTDPAAATKKRNRRKPNKTTKVFNDDEAHLGLPEEDDEYGGRFNGIASNGLDTAKAPDEAVVVNGSPTAGSFPVEQSMAHAQMNNGDGGGGADNGAAPVVVENSLGNNGSSVCDSREHSDDTPTPVTATTTVPIANDSVNNVAVEISQSDGVPPQGLSNAANMVTSTPTNAAAPTAKKRGRRKTVKPAEDSVDSEVETIDKIAEMISNTSTELERTTGSDAAKDPLVTAVNAGLVVGKEANYEDVENKLEEMFAGIIEEEDLSIHKSSEKPPDNVDQLVATAANSSIDLTGDDGTASSPPKKKPGRKRANSTTTNNKSEFKVDDTSDTAPPVAKKKRIQKKGVGNKNLKNTLGRDEGANKKNGNKVTAKSAGNATSSSGKAKSKDDAGTGPGELKYRGPFLQVKKCGNMSVINAPIADDDAEKSMNKSKKIIHRETMNDRNKIRGLHVSTLSMKYDADTTDQTWLCVFCKLGPHKSGLGDLFGPYIVTTDSEEFQYSQVDPEDDVFGEKKSRLDLSSKRANNQLCSPQAKKRKKATDSPLPSTSHPKAARPGDIDIHAGMVKANDNTYEVWVHEECAVWAPGVHMIGARIVGLEAAIWTSCRHKCTICNGYGAMLGCLKHNCGEKAHINCAYSSNWKLGTDFKSFCETHNA